jgi:hypothetical protein
MTFSGKQNAPSTGPCTRTLNDGDQRHGTADDPRIVLIGIDIHAAVSLEVNKPKPVVLFELAKGWFTGERVEAGDTHTLSEPHR